LNPKNLDTPFVESMDLNILYVTGCLHTEASGTFQSLNQTVDHIQRAGQHAVVAGTRAYSENRSLPNTAIEVHGFKRIGPKSLHYAPAFKKWLAAQNQRFDLVSLQSVWLFVHKWAAAWCENTGTSLMVTPHGNFNPYALGLSSFKKRIATRTFMRGFFEKVDCYQALTEKEYENIRSFGIRKPICVIGNGIDLPVPGSLPHAADYIPDRLLSRRTCLYMGRIAPIKALDRLLKAWSVSMRGDDWQLVIAGVGDSDYEKELKSLSDFLGCVNVHFVGFVSGVRKSLWLEHCESFILPSHSEAFPMSVLEAMSHAKPVIATAACGLSHMAKAGVLTETENSVEALADALHRMALRSQHENEEMGRQAYEYVVSNYSWGPIVQRLESVYRWLVQGGDTPSDVRLY
jgi:glycosyltransferase involved in cell wall biosynthesis